MKCEKQYSAYTVENKNKRLYFKGHLDLDKAMIYIISRKWGSAFCSYTTMTECSIIRRKIKQISGHREKLKKWSKPPHPVVEVTGKVGIQRESQSLSIVVLFNTHVAKPWTKIQKPFII